MEIPALPPDYKDYLEANLNWFERLGTAFSSLDERIDYTNILLTKLLELQGGIPPATPEWVDRLIDAINLISIGGVPPNREVFLTGQRTVTTAGTAVQLTTSSILVPDGFQLTVIAKPGNTGVIYFGRSKGDAEGASKFDALDAGLAHSFHIKNVNLIWVGASVDEEGVSWYVEQ